LKEEKAYTYDNALTEKKLPVLFTLCDEERGGDEERAGCEKYGPKVS